MIKSCIHCSVIEAEYRVIELFTYINNLYVCTPQPVVRSTYKYGRLGTTRYIRDSLLDSTCEKGP